MVSVASQLIEEVTAHVQSDSLEDAREIWADGTYFPNKRRKIKGKDKPIPLQAGQALRVPEGWGAQVLRKLEHQGGKAVSPMQEPPVHAFNIPGTHLSEAKSPRGP